MASKRQSCKAVIVFDIGGTYFRSGLYTFEGKLINTAQQPAINFHSASHLSVIELKQALFNYLIDTARKYAEQYGVKRISISLGAALDGHRGIIYGSGPLWGSENEAFDLLSLLYESEPTFKWHIVNDVTAGLIHYVHSIREVNVRKILLLTISTGIASRLFDYRHQSLALDEFGLQGEIGHLPVVVLFNGKTFELDCDCGGKNHLAAFSSGRGLIKLSNLLAKEQPSLWQASTIAKLYPRLVSYEVALTKALEINDPFALTLLYLATKPVADSLRYALTFDPEIDRIVLTGGMVVSLATAYCNMLRKHFSEAGLYLSSQFDPDFIERRLVIADHSQVNNLIGAALWAMQELSQE